VRRSLALFVAGLASVAALMSSAPAASAAGTGGVELTPIPTVDKHGKAVTAFHVHTGTQARFALRNLTDHVATVRVYAAAATRSSTGAYSIGGSGSARWVELPAQTVTMAAHAVQYRSMQISTKNIPKGTAYGAVVVEQVRGTVAQRAATLVYLDRGTVSPVRRALLPIGIAVGLLALVIAVHGLLRMRRRQPKMSG
jgi:hypothetical protein